MVNDSLQRWTHVMMCWLLFSSLYWDDHCDVEWRVSGASLRRLCRVWIFTAQCCASAVYAVVLCSSVCLS